jgi:hypothetical protein
MIQDPSIRQKDEALAGPLSLFANDQEEGSQ